MANFQVAPTGSLPLVTLSCPRFGLGNCVRTFQNPSRRHHCRRSPTISMYSRGLNLPHSAALQSIVSIWAVPCVHVRRRMSAWDCCSLMTEVSAHTFLCELATHKLTYELLGSVNMSSYLQCHLGAIHAMTSTICKNIFCP